MYVIVQGTIQNYSFMLLFQDKHNLFSPSTCIVDYFLYKCNGSLKATFVIL